MNSKTIASFIVGILMAVLTAVLSIFNGEIYNFIDFITVSLLVQISIKIND